MQVTMKKLMLITIHNHFAYTVKQIQPAEQPLQKDMATSQ